MYSTVYILIEKLTPFGETVGWFAYLVCIGVDLKRICMAVMIIPQTMTGELFKSAIDNTTQNGNTGMLLDESLTLSAQRPGKNWWNSQNHIFANFDFLKSIT